MSIGEIIITIIASIGGSAVLLLAISWLAKSIISHLLTKDVETYKAKLQTESQREMNQLKSSLERIAFEHQVRFSRLHEKRAEIIDVLYSKIDDVHKVISDFVRHYSIIDDSSKDQKINDMRKTFDDFQEFFDKRKIYFDVNICEKIISFKEELSHACSTLISLHKDKGVIDLQDGAEHHEWLKAMSSIDKEVSEVKRVLEASFREILGVLQPKQNRNP